MGKIIVIGHGYEVGQLTLEAAELLLGGTRVILHTGRCGCAEWLEKNEIAYETLDALYESCEDFDEHIEAAADAVCTAAEQGDVAYGVFDVRDRTVAELMERRPKDVRLIAGPPVEGALFAYAQGAVQLLEASDWEAYKLSSGRTALVRELDNRELASEVKLKLMDCYPDESVVYVRTSGGIARTHLYNLDRMKEYDHRTCVLVPGEKDLKKLERYDFERFQEVISTLLGPFGCPWDKAQTHESLRTYMIEEAYEVVNAIDEDDPYHLYDELGDMLLQIALHAEIANQHGEFDMMDVTTAISEKMISRHSHVFGKDHTDDVEQVVDLWSRNKMAERGQTTYTESMQDIARSLPAMLRAKKVLKRLNSACQQKDERTESIRNAVMLLEKLDQAKDGEKLLGEALLQIASVARACDVDPEIALNAAVDRLIARFEKIESEVIAQGGSLDAECEETLRKYWDLVKLSETGE